MSDFDALRIMWAIGTLCCSIGIIGMLWLYRSFDESMSLLTRALNIVIDHNIKSIESGVKKED